MRIHEFSKIISDTRPICILLRATRIPVSWFIFAQMRTINAILASIRYFGWTQSDMTCVQVYFLFISPSVPRSHWKIFVTACYAYAHMFARWNALDNCYYLKLHLLPPFFFTNFCDKYPDGGFMRIGKCTANQWFFYAKICNESPRKIWSGRPRSPTEPTCAE